MRITITIDSDEIGAIEISSPAVHREAGDNPRAVAAALLADVLVPRALGALQITRAVPDDLDEIRAKAEAYDALIGESSSGVDDAEPGK